MNFVILSYIGMYGYRRGSDGNKEYMGFPYLRYAIGDFLMPCRYTVVL